MAEAPPTGHNVYFHLWKRFTKRIHPPNQGNMRTEYIKTLKESIDVHFNPCWAHPADTSANSLLHLCILSGDVETLEIMLDRNTVNIAWYLSPLNSQGHTPLMTALLIGDYECARVLMNAFHTTEESTVMTHFLMSKRCRLPFLNQEDLTLYTELSHHKTAFQQSVQETGSEVQEIAIKRGFFISAGIVSMLREIDTEFEKHRPAFKQTRHNRTPVTKLMESAAVEPTPLTTLPFFTQYKEFPDDAWVAEIRGACLAGRAFTELNYTHNAYTFDPLSTEEKDNIKNLIILDCLRVAALCRNWVWFVKTVYDLSFVKWGAADKEAVMSIEKFWLFVLGKESLLWTPITWVLQTRKPELFPLMLLGSGNRTAAEMSDAFAAMFLWMMQSKYTSAVNTVIQNGPAVQNVPNDPTYSAALDNALTHLSPDGGGIRLQHTILLEPNRKFKCSVLVSRLICLFAEADDRTFSMAIRDFFTPLYQDLKNAWARMAPPNADWFVNTDQNKFLRNPQCMRSSDFLNFVINHMLVPESFRSQTQYTRPVQNKLMKIAFESGADLSKLSIPSGLLPHQKFVAGVPSPVPHPPEQPLIASLLLTFDAVLLRALNDSGIFESDHRRNFAAYALMDDQGQMSMPAELEHVTFIDKLIELDFPPVVASGTQPEPPEIRALHQTPFHVAAERAIGASQELGRLIQNALGQNKTHFLFFQDINGNTFLHLFLMNTNVVQATVSTDPKDAVNKRDIFTVFSLLKKLDSTHRKTLLWKKNKKNISVAYILMSRPATVWPDQLIREVVNSCGDPKEFDFITPQGRGHQAPKDLKTIFADSEIEDVPFQKRAADIAARGVKRLKGLFFG